MFIECCIRISVCKGLAHVREVCASHINDANEMNVVSRERQSSNYLLLHSGVMNILDFSVDKKNQLDVTFCIIYFSSNSCSTCFGQPCAHHQELTTA